MKVSNHVDLRRIDRRDRGGDHPLVVVELIGHAMKLFGQIKAGFHIGQYEHSVTKDFLEATATTE